MPEFMNLTHWDVSFYKFQDWVEENNVKLEGTNVDGGFNSYSTRWYFANEEDYVAFTLRFRKIKNAN